MVRRARRRAGSHIGRGSVSSSALAADVFLRWLSPWSTRKAEAGQAWFTGLPMVFLPPQLGSRRATAASAKLLVPAGGLDQANGGETFSPTQFALPGVLLEFFFLQRGTVLEA